MKKNVKRILFSILSLSSLGTMLIMTSNSNNADTKISKQVILKNQPNLYSDNFANEYANKKILTPEMVKKMNWDNKTSILLNDWKQYMPEVVEIGNKAFANNQNLISIEIPNNILIIQESAFEKTKKLTSIKFEDNSSLKLIGDSAFDSSSITNINIPDSINIIGNSAFKNCLILSDISTSNNLISIGNDAFFGLINLKHLNLSNLFKENYHILGLKEEQLSKINWLLQKTNLKNHNIEINDFKEVLPSLYSDDQIKKLILNQLLEYTPLDFDLSNIDLPFISRDNLNGVITVDVVLNKYFDQNGVESLKKNQPSSIKLSGFKKINSNILSSGIFLLNNVDHIKPQDYSDQQILSFLKSKIGDVPENFEFKFINCSWDINEDLGRVSFVLNMTNFYDEKGNIQNTTSEPIKIILEGFKTKKMNLIDIHPNDKLGLSRFSKSTWIILGLLFTEFIILGSLNIFFIKKIKNKK